MLGVALMLDDRQSTPWADCKSIASLTWRQTTFHTYNHPYVQLKVHLICMPLDCRRKKEHLMAPVDGQVQT